MTTTEAIALALGYLEQGDVAKTRDVLEAQQRELLRLANADALKAIREAQRLARERESLFEKSEWVSVAQVIEWVNNEYLHEDDRAKILNYLKGV